MKPILRSLSGHAVGPPPLWLMRQAGRHLPEYRAVRQAAGGFLDLVATPAKACEVTVQPVARYGMDGAILFSDILIVPLALGQRLWFAEGEGPKLGPMPTHFDFDAGVIAPILETLRLVRQHFDGQDVPDRQVTTLGFVGAPWTVVTYMVEQGKPTFDKSRAFLETARAADVFAAVIDATIVYAKAQVAAGAEVIKIFDSWAGQLLTGDDFRRWSLDPMVQIADALAPTPVIFFPRGQGKMAGLFRDAFTGPFGFAVGDGDDLAGVRESVGPDVCLQGNLSPKALLGPEGEQVKATQDILDHMAGSPHIFNLGHGVDKDTDPARVQMLVDQVRGF